MHFFDHILVLWWWELQCCFSKCLLCAEYVRVSFIPYITLGVPAGICPFFWGGNQGSRRFSLIPSPTFKGYKLGIQVWVCWLYEVSDFFHWSILFPVFYLVKGYFCFPPAKAFNVVLVYWLRINMRQMVVNQMVETLTLIWWLLTPAQCGKLAGWWSSLWCTQERTSPLMFLSFL